jgi:hypothetical protein
LPSLLVIGAFRAFKQGCQMVYFQTKKFQFGYTLEGLGMENVFFFNIL